MGKRATEDVECFPLCLAAVSCPYYRRTLERFAVSKQSSELWQVGEEVGSKLARVCPSVLVSLREGEGRSAGNINRSCSAQSTAAGQECLNLDKTQGTGEGLSRMLSRKPA